MNKENHRVSSIIIDWYQKNKRELPWRETSDPYIIWISEIILQQTRVAQGLDYYLRFVHRFPNVISLAKAEEDEVLTYWQGLGYYSRARNLHTASKVIAKNFNGIFPNKYEDVLSLKGVGEYTAAAIVSFAYNQPYAVVDGNVFRVLARLLGVKQPIDTGTGKKLFTQIANELLDKGKPGIHNQAIMEFGALQCVPVNPNCDQCPLNTICVALEKGEIGELPKKQGKNKIQNRYFNYLDIRFEGRLLLKKRTGNDIWRNLYELPLIETSDSISLSDLVERKEFKEMFPQNIGMKITTAPLEFKHVLSHRIIYAKFYTIELTELPRTLEQEFVQVMPENLPDYAISRLVSKYFEKRT